MKTAILGGAGFIGRHLTTALAAEGGAEIVLIDLDPPLWHLPANVKFLRGDVRQAIDILDFKPDLLVNLAAIHRTPGHPDDAYHETNETGAERAVELCEKHNVRRLWFTSSIAVYGPTETAKNEKSVLDPDSAYGRSKEKAEEIQRQWAAATGDARLLIVRPATVFGAGEGGNFSRLAKSLAHRSFLYPGRRDTLKACGYVNDLVASMSYMEQFAAPEIIYNFAYPEPPTIEEVCEAFHKTAGLPRPLGTLPSPVLSAAASILSRLGRSDFDPMRIEKLVRSTNIIPTMLIEKEYPYLTNLSTALADWQAEAPAGEFV